MTRASVFLLTLLLTLLLTVSCQRPSGAARDAVAPTDAVTRPLRRDVVRADPMTPVAAWCFEPMERADLRAIDDEGRVWTVRGDAIARDGDDRPTTLASEPPCPSRGAYALEFVEGGAAYALVSGRFYVRTTRAAPFIATPICTDLGGAPWSVRAHGGWCVIANAGRSVGPGLLITREAAAATGWYAVTALDRSTTAGVLDGHQSLLSLVNNGHLVLVDQRQTVAGEVLAARGESFATLSRSPAGVVATHDAPDRHRVMVSARSLAEPFARVESQRDDSRPTRSVVVIDLARVVAVTDDTVELSVDRGRSFRTVLRVAATDGGAVALERPHVGRLRDGRLAVATRDGLAVDRCR